MWRGAGVSLGPVGVHGPAVPLLRALGSTRSPCALQVAAIATKQPTTVQPAAEQVSGPRHQRTGVAVRAQVPRGLCLRSCMLAQGGSLPGPHSSALQTLCGMHCRLDKPAWAKLQIHCASSTREPQARRTKSTWRPQVMQCSLRCRHPIWHAGLPE